MLSPAPKQKRRYRRFWVLAAERVRLAALAITVPHLARPDIASLDTPETVDIVARIADRISIPILVDRNRVLATSNPLKLSRFR